MRIAVGGISHETNFFSTTPATLSAFRSHLYLTGEDMIGALKDAPSPLGGVLSGLGDCGFQAVPLLYAATNPCGQIGRDDFFAMLEDLLERFARSLPLDGVIIAPHGAMTADGIADCEGTLLEAVRKVVGYDIPLIAVIDLHANIGKKMFEEADALVGYDVNPHTDQFEKGVEAVALMSRLLRDGTRLHKRFVQLPLLLSPLTTWTDANPLASTMPLREEWKRDQDILCITVAGGFVYTWNEEAGVSIAVYGTNAATIERCAREIANCVWEKRQAALYSGITVDQAIGQALFSMEKTVALADMGDNIGGGSPGDGTLILEKLIEHKVKGAFVTVWDAKAASAKSDFFQGYVGAKSDPRGGRPVFIRGPVIRRSDGRYPVEKRNPHSAGTGKYMDMGESILVDADGIHVLITSIAAPQGDIDFYRHLGVDPNDYKILAVKGAVAFRAAYRPVTKVILDVNTEGACHCDLTKFSLPDALRDKYPLNPEREWRVDEEIMK